MTNETILIVGGGVAGLTVKTRLEALGYTPVLAEKADTLRTDGAGLLLGANVLKIFREMGIEEHILAHAQTLDELRSTDSKGGSLGYIDLAKVRQETSYPTVAIHRHDLHTILTSCSLTENYWLGHRVTGIDPSDTGYRVAFANGKQVGFDRVIAADGLFSKVRESTVGDVGFRHTEQACWRFVTDTPDALDRHIGIEMWGDRKRVGIFPMGKNKTYIFLVASMEGGEKTFSFEQVLRHFREFEGPWKLFKETIDTSSTELLYGELADAEKITLASQGIPFIGDAGHSTTPNMGQGAAMGIESAYLFTELLKNNDFDTALGQYVTKRYNRVHDIREKSMTVGKIAHIRSKTLQKIRNIAMGLIPQSLTQREFEKALLE